MISMATGMRFFVKQRGRTAGKWQWWGNNLFWLVLAEGTYGDKILIAMQTIFKKT